MRIVGTTICGEIRLQRVKCSLASVKFALSGEWWKETLQISDLERPWISLHILMSICIFFTQLKFFRINFQKPLDKSLTKVYNTPIKSDERKQVDRRRPHREPSDGVRRRGGFG